MRSVYLLTIAVAAVATLGAQETVSPLAVNIGAGFSQGVGRSGRDLDLGWHIAEGAGYNFNRHVAAMIDLDTELMGTAATVPGYLSVSGGRMSVFSATFDPVVHLTSGHPADVYLTGGGGMFRRSFSPAMTFALRSGYSVIKPGFDVGLGIAVGSAWHGKFYAEARYDHIFDNNRFFTNYVPVTFGFRW